MTFFTSGGDFGGAGFRRFSLSMMSLGVGLGSLGFAENGSNFDPLENENFDEMVVESDVDANVVVADLKNVSDADNVLMSSSSSPKLASSDDRRSRSDADALCKQVVEQKMAPSRGRNGFPIKPTLQL